MVTKRKTKTSAVKSTDLTKTLADRLKVARPFRAYALHYYTVGGSDTEYLISNPNHQVVKVSLVFFGRNCKIEKKQQFTLEPNCTKSLRLRAIVPDHAGHAILTSTLNLVGHILYLHTRDRAVVGGELAGRDNIFAWANREIVQKIRTKIYTRFVDDAKITEGILDINDLESTLKYEKDE